MSKNILNDIIESRKNSPSFSRVRREHTVDVSDSEVHNAEDIAPKKKKKRRGLRWVIGVVALLGFIGILFSVIFSGASVTITPRAQSFSFDGTFEARERSLNSPGVLSYEVLEISEIASKEVPARGTEYVKTKASGEIIVYNAYSSKPQKLVNNTRFEASDGSIYRIGKPIQVPGFSKSGGEIVPGSIEVMVYADEPGASYNSGHTEFTIPGLKGSAMYDGFYARSKTPIEGGALGERKQVSQTDQQEALRELRSALTEKLTDRVHDELSEGFAVFDDGIFLEFSDVSDTYSPSEDTSDMATVAVRGVVRAAIFAEGLLAEAIADQVVDTFDGRPVTIPELDAFRFIILDKEDIDIETGQSFSFSLAGSGRIVWSIDKDQIRDALATKPKKEFQKILTSFLNIERAATVIRPFWSRNFPDNEDKILVELVVPEIGE